MKERRALVIYGDGHFRRGTTGGSAHREVLPGGVYRPKRGGVQAGVCGTMMRICRCGGGPGRPAVTSRSPDCEGGPGRRTEWRRRRCPSGLVPPTVTLPSCAGWGRVREVQRRAGSDRSCLDELARGRGRRSERQRATREVRRIRSCRPRCGSSSEETAPAMKITRRIDDGRRVPRDTSSNRP